MSKDLKILVGCILLAIAICVAHIVGNTVLVLGVLVLFLLLLGWSCVKNYTLPVLLFFLPWSALLKLNPGDISFYTVGIVLVCVIGVAREGFSISKKYLLLGGIVLLLTLFVRLMNGSMLSLSYLQFMMLLFLLPIVQRENQKKAYDFFYVVVFFQPGIVIAAFLAQNLVSFPNIQKFVVVYSYLTVTRWSGFYSDPNFYAAQITAAIAGTLLLVLRSEKKWILPLALLSILLIYCGLLSGSKSFLLIFLCILLIWLVQLFRMRGRSAVKMLIYGVLMLIMVFIASSAVFKDLLNIVLTRFALGDRTLDGFTTGRTEIWKNYFNEIFGDMKVFLLGHGMENVLVEGRAPHNTIIQIVFQFGMLGTPFVIVWCWNFLQLPLLRGVKKKSDILLLSVGALLPWLALDMLFLDDFFMILWFLLMGLHFIMDHEAENIAEK